MNKYFWFPFFLSLFFIVGVGAHEKWVLTPAQVIQYNQEPVPELFNTINSTNVGIYLFTLIFLFGWISLNYTGAREFFPDLQQNLSSLDSYSSVILRYAMGIMLGMAAFGLAPRVGTEVFQVSTLAAPELELHTNWAWLAYIEGAIAISFFLGIYVSFAAFIMLLLGFLGIFLWGTDFFDYFFLVAAAGVYLLMRGPGHFFIPLPQFPGTKKISQWLENQPKERATFLLRILAGIGFLYLGIFFKFAQPNLAIAVVNLNHVPTFGLSAETFVFWMAIVETLTGVMLLAGVMMRPMALLLTFCFAIFSLVLGEGVFSHSIAYGLLATLFINGAGRWRLPEAHDKPSKIVIIENSISGIHAALRLERILGEHTHVDVTFISKEPFFQFNPLLPEVIAGSIQPGGVVNPNKRVCPRTKFLLADVESIDQEKKQIIINDKKNQKKIVPYDQLILAKNLVIQHSLVSGLEEHSFNIMNVRDALKLRERIYDCIEQAEYHEINPGLLTFVVLGGDLRGCAVAAEINRLIDTITPLFTKVTRSMCHVILVDKNKRVMQRFKETLSKLATYTLKKAGVECYLGEDSEVIGITKHCVKFKNGKVIPTETVITSLTEMPEIALNLKGTLPGKGLEVNEYLQLKGDPNIFVTGDVAEMNKNYRNDPRREKHLGKKGAYNAWALSQGYKFSKWRESTSFLYTANLGKHASVGVFCGIPLHGFIISFIARLQCLLVLPGLERNTRIFLDWLLDIPFKNDIVVLSQKSHKKLDKSYFLEGDEIIRQGEIGESAYIIESGEVEVLKDNESVATLGKGACIGEISLLQNEKSNATIRCKTNVYVTELARKEFDQLLSGFPAFKEAIKSIIQNRLK